MHLVDICTHSCVLKTPLKAVHLASAGSQPPVRGFTQSLPCSTSHLGSMSTQSARTKDGLANLSVALKVIKEAHYDIPLVGSKALLLVNSDSSHDTYSAAVT